MLERKTLLKRIYNFFFCLKYPFYKMELYSAEKKKKKTSYSWTWYTSIPDGWQKAFGKQLSKDLKKVLKETKQLKTFKITDIKEKWGVLRIYSTNCSDEVDAVLDKYEQLSMCYCINCGSPVRYHTEATIAYLCETCFMQYVKRLGRFGGVTSKNVSQIYEDARLREKNIPQSSDIDFYEKWGIKKDNK